MGTRNLTAVFKDGQYKVAQYGQWDGYPSGQGKTILRFLHTLSEGVYRKKFLSKLESLSFITDAEIDAMSQRIKAENIADWTIVWPELSREAGGEILDMIMRSDRPIKLRNSINFAADSLLCEYAYVIDFDKNIFEVFEGFNTNALQDSERFYGYVRDGKPNGYQPVRLVRSYNLSSLPSESAFLSDLEPSDDSEE